jgi:hypothetical protein
LAKNPDYSLSARSRDEEAPLPDNAKIARVEWAIGILVVVMLGLYVWSHVTASHRIGKKLQPFVDDFFGVTPSAKQESKANPTAKPKSKQ